jgi:hypothetical protein
MKLLSKKEAIKYLEITNKEFENYHLNSHEIKGQKKGSRWFFSVKKLDEWAFLKKDRTVFLTIEEYKKCFQFAIKMSYSTGATHGAGIRGVRSEMQMADDFILGILAEHGVQKFLSEKYKTKVKLDLDVHAGKITPQDFVSIKSKGKDRECKVGVSIKSSKLKSCYNIIHPIEYENIKRRSDIYIFVRVGLPSDHLFRALREHSFFVNVSKDLEENSKFKKIEKLNKIPVWICGFNYRKDFKKVNEIPGQKFSGAKDYRYVTSVSEMKNSDKDWKSLVSKL